MRFREFLKMDKLRELIKATEWYHSSIALKRANKFDSVVYLIAWSKDKPTVSPFDWHERPLIKVGTSSGKGYGMADESMTGKFRTNRRKGTSQPKDRLNDHMVIMSQGKEANQIKKNIGNLAKAWAPVFDQYGYGPELLKNVWVSFLVPTHSMNFRDSSMFCEYIELGQINEHAYRFEGSAPLADLKYQNQSDAERRNLLQKYEDQIRTMSKSRQTRFQNDSDYADLETGNWQGFNEKPADLTPFLTKPLKKNNA